MQGWDLQSGGGRALRSVLESRWCVETAVQPLKKEVVMKKIAILLPASVVVSAMLISICGGSSQSSSSSTATAKATFRSRLATFLRFRFRHCPLAYLASLEARWEQASRTGILPS